MVRNWEDDKRWSDKYWPQIEQIIRGVVGDIVHVSYAHPREDELEATDFIVTVESGRIACRVRNLQSIPPQCRWKDVTIRSWRKSGSPTELSKLLSKLVRWYLYLWVDDVVEQVVGWLFYDVHRAVDLKVYDECQQIINRDGETAFIAVELQRLRHVGCVVREVLPITPALQVATASVALFRRSHLG